MTNIITYQPLNRDPPHGRPQWRFNVFAQDEGGEGLVGFAEVQINLKDVNDNAVSIKSHSFRIFLLSIILRKKKKLKINKMTRNMI